MDIAWDAIDHVTKVDPAKPLPDDLGILRETDLIMVGGSDDVTAENTRRAVARLHEAVPSIPIVQEPYDSTHVSGETIEAVDRVAVPAVFNGDRDHFVAKHIDFFTEICRKPQAVTGASLPLVGEVIAAKGRAAVREVASIIMAEGYVIQNLDSKAATLTGVERVLSPDEVAGAALATETFYGFPIFYVEYSGTYGGTEDVEAAAPYLEETTLLYGGGIRSREQADEILAAGADAIVVGDCFHDDPDRFARTIPQ